MFMALLIVLIFSPTRPINPTNLPRGKTTWGRGIAASAVKDPAKPAIQAPMNPPTVEKILSFLLHIALKGTWDSPALRETVLAKTEKA